MVCGSISVALAAYRSCVGGGSSNAGINSVAS